VPQVFKVIQALMVPREPLALVLQELLELLALTELLVLKVPPEQQGLVYLERQVLTEPLVLKVQQELQGPELRVLRVLLGLVLVEQRVPLVLPVLGLQVPQVPLGLVLMEQLVPQVLV
jgi:hypothetical protein